MPQPPDTDRTHSPQSLPAGFANSTMSRTLQHKVHSPQAFPGIASMKYARLNDSVVSILHGCQSACKEKDLVDPCSTARSFFREQGFDKSFDATAAALHTAALCRMD